MVEYVRPHQHAKKFVGNQVGVFMVLGLVQRTPTPIWHCECFCGRKVLLPTAAIKKMRSCGCERKPRRNIHHGMSKTRTYRIWTAMRQRCLNEKSDAWQWYGGRGIRVCDRWSVFQYFLEDMGECPPGLSLERINNDGDYEPGNCRWASHVEQMANVSTNRLLTANGETLHLGEWARRLGTPSFNIVNRLQRGWSIEEAVLLPTRGRIKRSARKEEIKRLVGQ